MAQGDHQTGLILSGGGARAAYQVGVLRAIGDLVPPRTRNPFPIISGTSAGAINAAGLAANSHNYRMATRGLERVWANLTVEQVYRTDLFSFLRSVMRWLFSSLTTGITPVHSALLDNTPLRRLLSLLINFQRIQQALEIGDLQALSVSASSYSTGESTAFFQARQDFPEWDRVRRKGRRVELEVDHLLASSALPILFPAERLGDQYFGDGALRQLSPLSPALHLGADRVLVIGVSANTEKHREIHSYPSMAQVLGHVLNSVFVDTLEADVERLERINQTVRAIPPAQRRKHDVQLREVDALKIYPSRPLDAIAAEHIGELPRTLRFFLRASGGTQSPGASAVSYLLFEPGFTRSLISLGYRDAMSRSAEIRSFLAPG